MRVDPPPADPLASGLQLVVGPTLSLGCKSDVQVSYARLCTAATHDHMWHLVCGGVRTRPSAASRTNADSLGALHRCRGRRRSLWRRRHLRLRSRVRLRRSLLALLLARRGGPSWIHRGPRRGLSRDLRRWAGSPPSMRISASGRLASIEGPSAYVATRRARLCRVRRHALNTVWHIHTMQM